MPQDIFLITEPHISLAELRTRIELGCPDLEVTEIAPGRLAISLSGQYLWIQDEPEVMQFYEPRELALIKKALPSPHVFGFEFHDMALVKRILRSIHHEKECSLVDDDHWNIVPLKDFLAQSDTP